MTLLRDRARALHFFRWKEQVQRRCSFTDDKRGWVRLSRCSSIHSTLPNFHHIPQTISPQFNENHLTKGSLDKYPEQSKSFILKIQNILAEGSPRTMRTVYQYQTTSIDRTPVLSPSLCLKLFDDRFQRLPSPDDESDDRVSRWFDALLIAEMEQCFTVF